jgi:hypothetical protein
LNKNYYHITKNSTNRKTGKIYVTTSSNSTCPDCPFKNNNGCYACGGPLRIHWNKVSIGERGVDFKTFIKILKDM